MPSIDLDTIKYPPVNPSLILSVSDAPYNESAHAFQTQILYVEKYSLEKYLSAEEPPAPPTPHHRITRFHLFTHELILGGDEKTLGFGLSGGDGTAENTTGGSGGEIVLCVEDGMIDKKGLEKFKLDVSGGTGFSPTPVPGKDTGADGGNGGNGGHIQIFLGQTGEEQGQPIKKIAKFINDLHAIMVEGKGKDWKWPDSFKDDEKFMTTLKELVTLSKEKDVTEVHEIDWKSTDDAFKGELSAFNKALGKMHKAFQPPEVTDEEDDRLALLEKSAVWKRGKYGHGARGDKEDGKNGKDGRDGMVFSKWLTVKKILDSSACLAHPGQCQMLLDKANVLYFLGTPKSTAKSRSILTGLEKRLVFLGGDQDNICDSSIADAYESAEKRLFIHATDPVSDDKDPDWKKKQNEEPAAVRQLRAIRDEASRVRKQIDSGFDFYGPDGDIIPNLAFETYENSLKDFIEHAAAMENSYRDYQEASNDADKKKTALVSASNATAQRRSTNEYYYKNALAVVEENSTKIEYLTAPLDKARKSLEGEVDTVQKLIQDAFNVSLKDAVSAIGQVLFTPSKAMPIMAGMQMMDLYEDASTKIENDLGEKLKKSYVIKKIKKITKPTLEGLYDQYSTSDDGKVTLKEGDTTKLAVAEEDLDSLIDSIADKLENGDAAAKTAKERFEKYISLIKERNNAVVQYNSALTLMRKSEKDRNTIDATETGISEQLSDLKTENPMLVLFMKRLYTDALTDTQLMFNRAQKALDFEFLTNFNAFANLSDYSSSHSSAALLESAKVELLKQHLTLKNARRPRQPFTNVKYPLSKLDVGGLMPGSTGNIKLMVNIARKTGDPFEGKADVRLTKVRFFAEGATTKSKQLNVTLTHEATETIYDEHGAAYRFSHPKQIVAFSYNTETMAVGDSDGTIGEQHGKDGYSLVGPFTSWWIDIHESNNKGLCGDIKNAWFEFDGEARPVVAS
ncbi:hypothetical protein MW887_004540 [Aspergillus wentii]|nr:hypothetical protein MW887_004540 [Aspergillus wentii]